MKCTISSKCRFLLPAAVLACSLSTSAVGAGPEIVVLSNRADLISGGDALVQINLPPAVNPALGVKVALNGTPINSMFAVRPNGHYEGLVTGLNNGDNLLTVTTPQGRPKSPSPITRLADQCLPERNCSRGYAQRKSPSR